MPTTTTISTWLADYTGADLNTPTGATVIPLPAVLTTDLGQVIRDRKTVIRQESLNKGWYPDTVNATRISNTSFKSAGNLTTAYPVGMAIKGDLSGLGTVYTSIINTSFAAGNTTFTTANGALNASLNTITASPFLPSSDPLKNLKNYAVDIGSSLPARVMEIGQIQVGPTNTGEMFATRFRNMADAIFIVQAVSAIGGTPSNGSLRFYVTKPPAGPFLVLAAAPGAGVTVTYEYCVLRVT